MSAPYLSFREWSGDRDPVGRRSRGRRLMWISSTSSVCAGYAKNTAVAVAEVSLVPGSTYFVSTTAAQEFVPGVSTTRRRLQVFGRV